MKGANKTVAFAILARNLACSETRRSRIAHAQETVWRAWFDGDTNTLKKLVPPEMILMSGGEE